MKAGKKNNKGNKGMVLMKSITKELVETLKKDKGFYYAYQSNIAMAFYDVAVGKGIPNKKLHEIANDAAKNFLDVFIKS